ncbi:MAG: tryptophan halogenase [Sphingomonas bacterium]|uniref:tryptophan 7-halogenase n=1 Tax=Sphingomonas bacterium TaxID=1895847 RepID=UPI002606511E|nr:tryptophan 7-halogenase [Sphingomonas bacterium]MDB5704346.1 tryptophan halogenase [Sphingomonas bacterium]
MSAPIDKVVVAGRDAALWLTANVLASALEPAGVTVEAVELPSALGPADVHATLPPLEALHNQLRIEEAALLRATRGAFSLGQNFVDTSGNTPSFLHAHGAHGAPIEGNAFFPYWIKARRAGLDVGLEHFSLAAAAATQGRLMIPDDESDVYGRSDYGYHLPAIAYARSLKALARQQGVTMQAVTAVEAVLDPESGDIVALDCDGGRRVEGHFFVDATGPQGALIGAALGVPTESWRDHFVVDRLLVAHGPQFASIPVYAELRASREGWTGIYPSQAQTHIVHAWSSAQRSDDDALKTAASICGFALDGGIVRASDPGRRELAWVRNCVAIGEAACAFDPVHSVDLHAVQLGLVHLLACFPASGGFVSQRDEYNRIVQSAFERARDFQSAYYALNRYGDSPFWAGARQSAISPELTHMIATFRSRGEVAPWEDETFSPDSWQALFVGLGLTPESYPPTIDRTPPEEVKAQFRRMLGFVKEQVLRQPTHNAYLDSYCGREHG